MTESARLLGILEQMRELHAQQLVLVTDAIQELKDQSAAGEAPSENVISLAAGGLPAHAARRA